MVKSENMRKNVMIYVIFLLMDNWKWDYNSLLHLLQFLKKKYLNKPLICEIKIDEVWQFSLSFQLVESHTHEIFLTQNYMTDSFWPLHYLVMVALALELKSTRLMKCLLKHQSHYYTRNSLEIPLYTWKMPSTGESIFYLLCKNNFCFIAFWKQNWSNTSQKPLNRTCDTKYKTSNQTTSFLNFFWTPNGIMKNDMFSFSGMISDSLKFKSWFVRWDDGTVEQSTL